jgi:hypothetical protein
MPTPTIIEQPSSQTILLGDGAAFNINSIDEGPLSYQWFKDNAEIVGATGNTYIIQTSTLNDNGDYHATVTNGDGTTTSNIATLTVNTPVPPSPTPPIIIEQPSSQTILLGDGAVFNVNASGESPFAYQWFKDNTEIVGATGNTYIIQTSTLNDTGDYKSTVTNTAGTTTSNIATLTVNVPVPPVPVLPTITSFAPSEGPGNQWIYMFGTNFVNGNTQIYFNTSSCSPVYVYTDTQIGFSIPSDVDTNGIFAVVTPNGEFTSSIEYIFAPATLTPTVTSLRDHPDPSSNWVYVDGTQFVNNQTTLTYDDNKTVNVFVYSTIAGGFSKINVDDAITSVLLTTPHGSVEFTSSVVIL